MDILEIIKLKNPEDITDKELSVFQSKIEDAINHLNALQRQHRELTGRTYRPPLKLKI